MTTELILSEVTRMAGGYCVIGLERTSRGYRSVRPMPPRSYAWGHPWPHQRGDRLGFELRARPCTQPHVEDRKAMRAAQSLGRIGHPELVGCLRSAEVARSTGELFGCALRSNPSGSGAAWVNPKEAARSICGCEFRFLRFFWRVDRWRVEVKLAGGETLKSLPIVDRDWNDFLDVAGAALGNVNREQRLHRFLNGGVAREIDQDEARFIRLGLTRTNDQGVCWLMLDSLFPLPRQEWVAELGESRGSNEKA